MNTLAHPPMYIKAIYAVVLSILGGLSIALVDNGVTTLEWITIATQTVLAGGGVYGLTNKTDTPIGAN